MVSNIIEVKNFTKQYGNFKAVDDISFSVEEGIIFAFLGPNGAGKTTTINALCTIIEKTNGELIINGHNTDKQKNLVRRDIGIVFQDSTIDNRLSVEENLKFHCDFYNVPKTEVKTRIESVLRLVDLLECKKAQVKSLSGGLKRRLEIARGIMHYPKVLFLDEPTAGLDPQMRANIWYHIKNLQRQENITVFFTTHYMDEAEICNKVAIIDHGKIIVFDTPFNLKKKYTSLVIKVSTHEKEKLINSLKSHNFKFVIEDETLKIFSPKLKSVLEFISINKTLISDIEINKGTLNDVFLSVTGREIRT